MQNIHVSFLRTVAPYFHQADVWATLLRHFNFYQVMVIHSSDVDGHAMLTRLQTHFQSSDDEGDQREIKVNILIINLIAFDLMIINLNLDRNDFGTGTGFGG